jgi:hypothetical protein
MTRPVDVDGMDADEIRDLSDRYDEGYPDDHETIEKDVHDRLTEQQYITQDQLAKVIGWKLDNQPGRSDRFTDDMRSVPDEFVRRVSEAALLIDDPKTQIKTLRSIPGIGPATATVVLAFYDPVNYAVGDRYIIDELFGEDRGFRVSDYPKLLEELRDRNPGDFDLRTLEKAYYRRYQEQNDIV